MPKFVGEVLAHYKSHKRTLPWRTTRDPYKILVSEIMLQQTQVDRVVPKYNLFIKTFPTATSLAKAPLSQVLLLWSGLGYNRRAKYLHEAAKIIVTDGFAGKLPGVGPYTKAAVETFAHNKPTVFIETNIRTVFIHFLISRTVLDIEKISDKELLLLVEKALQEAIKKGVTPRDWYAALMDYGAFLKANGIKLNAKSKHYTKQSKFEGSARQLRGMILRELLKNPQTLAQLKKHSARNTEKIKKELINLKKDKLIVVTKNRFAIAD